MGGLKTKLLFICSRNLWRSRTAEDIFKGTPGLEVRSAGTQPGARIRVTESLIRWADIVFVMERKHRDILQERFEEAMDGRAVYCLDIPDEFSYMDAELVELLRDRIGEIIGVR